MSALMGPSVCHAAECLHNTVVQSKQATGAYISTYMRALHTHLHRVQKLHKAAVAAAGSLTHTACQLAISRLYPRNKLASPHAGIRKKRQREQQSRRG